MQDEKQPASARVSAASLTLDRGHGEAPQVIETERYDIMTDQELDKQIREAVAGLRAMGIDSIRNWFDCKFEITDETGRLALTVPFEETVWSRATPFR